MAIEGDSPVLNEVVIILYNINKSVPSSMSMTGCIQYIYIVCM